MIEVEPRIHLIIKRYRFGGMAAATGHTIALLEDLRADGCGNPSRYASQVLEGLTGDGALNRRLLRDLKAFMVLYDIQTRVQQNV